MQKSDNTTILGCSMWFSAIIWHREIEAVPTKRLNNEGQNDAHDFSLNLATYTHSLQVASLKPWHSDYRTALDS